MWVSFFTCSATEIQYLKKNWNRKKLKKLETRKKHEKTSKETWKNHIYKTRRTLKPDLKPDGLNVKFNLTTFFHDSGFQSTRPRPITIPNVESSDSAHFLQCPSQLI
jgi:hypothetical protein